MVDDVGLHAGVNSAALQLAGLGRVHALGCMVGGAAWAQVVPQLRALDAGQVDLGLHLDLTETPLSRGAARPLRSLLRDSLLRRLDARALRQEIDAQLDRFMQALGRPPDYVDGHQHVHQFPQVRQALLAALAALPQAAPGAPAVRPWLRSTRRALRAGPLSLRHWQLAFKPWGIEQLGCAALTGLAVRAGHAQNRHLLGVYDFSGGAARYAGLLHDWLVSAHDGDLLMCHPADRPPEADPLGAARAAEYSVLAAPGFGALLAQTGVVLRPMRQILADCAGAQESFDR